MSNNASVVSSIYFFVLCLWRFLLFWQILYWKVICFLLVSSFSYSFPSPPLLSDPLTHVSSLSVILSCYFFLLPDVFFNPAKILIFRSFIEWSKIISSFISSVFSIWSSQDPTVMSSSSRVDHAVIGGVVAVIVFILLCLLIVFGRYLIRHKGRLLTL